MHLNILTSMYPSIYISHFLQNFPHSVVNSSGIQNLPHENMLEIRSMHRIGFYRIGLSFWVFGFGFEFFFFRWTIWYCTLSLGSRTQHSHLRNIVNHFPFNKHYAKWCSFLLITYHEFREWKKKGIFIRVIHQRWHADV